jgi:hypothetical protein
MTGPIIKIDGKTHKVYGQYGNKSYAKRMVEMESQGGTAIPFWKFGIRKVYVGKSVDSAYSDKEGYAWVVYFK